MSETSLTDEQRRALTRLVDDPEGCMEALLLVQGFTIDVIVDLVAAGLATATIEENGVRVRITRAGRQALVR
jgi:hypothetical protein